MNFIVLFSLILIKITLEWGVGSFQPPANYPPFLALMIGQIETHIMGYMKSPQLQACDLSVSVLWWGLRWGDPDFLC